MQSAVGASLAIARGAIAILAVSVSFAACAPAVAAPKSSGLLAQNAASDSTFAYAEIWTPTPARTVLHLHGGLFTPIDVNLPSPTLGMRLGRQVGSHLKAGVLTGWTLERKTIEQESGGIGGIQPHIILAQAEAHLVPVMGYLQVNLTEKHWLVPYGGIGFGYEWLILEAKDYVDGTVANATYSNWAFEGWAGVGIRLGQSLRLDSEVYYNGGALERDVVDPNDKVWREVVDVNGVGARVGLGILFQ